MISEIVLEAPIKLTVESAWDEENGEAVVHRVLAVCWPTPADVNRALEYSNDMLSEQWAAVLDV